MEVHQIDTRTSAKLQPLRLPLFSLPEPSPQYRLTSETAAPTSISIEFEHMSKPIDSYLSEAQRKRMFGYARLKENEILLPRDAFIKLGLPQPAFVSVSQPDQYLKLAVAFMSENNKSMVSGRFVSGVAEVQAAPLDYF